MVQAVTAEDIILVHVVDVGRKVDVGNIVQHSTQKERNMCGPLAWAGSDTTLLSIALPNDLRHDLRCASPEVGDGVVGAGVGGGAADVEAKAEG